MMKRTSKFATLGLRSLKIPSTQLTRPVTPSGNGPASNTRVLGMMMPFIEPGQASRAVGKYSSTPLTSSVALSNT
ncbi:hypothetical protein PSTG_17200 [Puccinia striiformis f. sp. tritici PST-78]|uniref:Uncharacterized protein n=1 Tax=Puccinia striiformis f. sp. tritici PST-78 TaxID=1165861 RepID=A0A0L0UQY9_9BASI|nr:hypothetical protein PSTG_17200 [Puccinia striiformis f. sp. tritici PST-78]